MLGGVDGDGPAGSQHRARRADRLLAVVRDQVEKDVARVQAHDRLGLGPAMVSQPATDGVARSIVVGQQAPVAHGRGDADEGPAIAGAEQGLTALAVGEDQHA